MENMVPTRMTIITKTDLLAYVRNELDSKSREVVDEAMALDPRVRTLVANCSQGEDVPPIELRHDDRTVQVA